MFDGEIVKKKIPFEKHFGLGKFSPKKSKKRSKKKLDLENFHQKHPRKGPRKSPRKSLRKSPRKSPESMNIRTTFGTTLICLRHSVHF